MAKNKFNQKAKNQSAIDNSNDSQNAKNGFKGTGNSGLNPGINDTKGKK